MNRWPGASPEQVRSNVADGLGGLTRGLHRITKPIIGAVNGWALAGGFETAHACDIRIASDGARFGSLRVRSDATIRRRCDPPSSPFSTWLAAISTINCASRRYTAIASPQGRTSLRDRSPSTTRPIEGGTELIRRNYTAWTQGANSGTNSAATLDQIGDRLGLSKASLYYYIEGKDQLITAVLKVVLDHGNARALKLIDPATGPLEQLKMRAQAHVESAMLTPAGRVIISNLDIVVSVKAAATLMQRHERPAQVLF